MLRIADTNPLIFSKSKVGVKCCYGSRCKYGTFSKIVLMVLGVKCWQGVVSFGFDCYLKTFSKIPR